MGDSSSNMSCISGQPVQCRELVCTSQTVSKNCQETPSVQNNVNGTASSGQTQKAIDLQPFLKGETRHRSPNLCFLTNRYALKIGCSTFDSVLVN